MKFFKIGVSHQNILIRLLSIMFFYWLIFSLCVTLSHIFLPEGFLKGVNTGGKIAFSSNVIISTFQIFLYNVISLVAIIIGSLFAKRKNEKETFLSLGIQVLFVLAIIFGVTLGTNSFGVEVDNTSLVNKFLGLCNVFKYSALWETTGLILFTTAFSQKALVLTTGKNTITKSIRKWSFNKSEVFLILIGLTLMIIGAFIESNSINILNS